MSNPQHFRKLERMYLSAQTNEYYRPRIEVGEDTAEIVIDVRPEFFHAARAVHGSVYFKALDDAAYFAVNSLIKDVLVLTSQFNIYLVRPVSRGELKAQGHVVHRSKRIFLAQAELRDADGNTLARGSGSFMRSRIPLSADVGYS